MILNVLKPHSLKLKTIKDVCVPLGVTKLSIVKHTRLKYEVDPKRENNKRSNP